MESKLYKIKNHEAEEKGPYSKDQLRKLLEANEISDQVLVCEVNEFGAELSPEQKISEVLDAASSVHEENTVIIGPDSEKTVIKAFDIEEPSYTPSPIELESPSQMKGFHTKATAISDEKTGMFTMPEQKKRKWTKKTILFATVGVIAGLILLFSPEEKKSKTNLRPFSVEMPAQEKTDHAKSEKLFMEGIPHYASDTAEGYKKSASLFLQSASYDSNNVKALSLLASSYLNLIDVIKRDENYFNVVMKLIELARAKGLDFTETMISDVELYLVLGNPDAAISRIIEFSKAHQYTVEHYYFLALSYYYRNDYENTLKYLAYIEPKNWFSPRIPYLYGLAFRKTNQVEEAQKALEETIKRENMHLKARVELADLLFQKDELARSEKNCDFVIQNAASASKADVARVRYIRARINTVAAKDAEAIEDLELAVKFDPDNSDYVLEYYTAKARVGGSVKDAKSKARMYDALAQGERALKSKNIPEAIRQFVTAKQAQEKDVTPLLKLAEVFKLKGDYQSAKIQLAKAVKMYPARSDLYYRYIRILIEAYELDEAKRNLDILKGLDGVSSLQVDQLNGELLFRQEMHANALAYFKRAASNPSANESAYLDYAKTLYAMNSFQDAAFFYGLALRFDPTNVDAVIGVAKSIAELDGLSKGVEYITGRAKILPEYLKPKLFNGLAELFLKKGDYDGAQASIENALRLDKDNPLIHKTKGDILVAKEKYREALDAYLTFSNLAPQDPTGYIERHRIFMRKKDFKNAREALERVLQAYPKYPGAYLMLGEMYKQAQNLKSAVEALQMEVKYYPNNIRAYTMAGEIYNINKNYIQASEVLNQALRLNPNYVPALIELGEANRNLKSYGAAKALLNRALSMDMANPEIHKRLIYLYKDMNELDLAKQHYSAYINYYPDSKEKPEIERYLNK